MKAVAFFFFNLEMVSTALAGYRNVSTVILNFRIPSLCLGFGDLPGSQSSSPQPLLWKHGPPGLGGHSALDYYLPHGGVSLVTRVNSRVIIYHASLKI